jgi:hypothetical protein
MKAAKAWCLATVVLMASISLASCGKDEGTGGGGGTVLGGSSGSGGTGGSAGNPGRAGSDSGVSTVSKLGQACVNDTQCNDPTAPGLTCVTAKDTALGGAAPPKGLCTAPCTMPSANGPTEDECAAFGTNALCYPFESGSNTGYCIEGCAFGEPNVGEPADCHNRREFACYPALQVPTGDACVDDTDCQTDEICDSGECGIIVPGCLPGCRGDIDCAEGLFCDQSFLGGACVADKPTGKALGEPCTVKTGSGNREPDECIGFCQADTSGSTKGHCANSCGLGHECAWNSATEKFDGLCLYLSTFTTDGRDGTGDFGFCTLTCSCSDECFDSELQCSLLSAGELNDTFRGAGLCLPPSAATTEYDQCTSPTDGGAGAGGASGAAGAGPDAAGAGAGGVPGSGEAGAGGVTN